MSKTMTDNISDILNEGTAANRPQDKDTGDKTPPKLKDIGDPLDHVDDTGGAEPTKKDREIDAAKGVKSKTPARNADKLENGEKTVVHNPGALTVAEEIENLLNHPDAQLSEEFKTRAKAVFTAIVNDKAEKLAEEKVAELEKDWKAQIDASVQDLNEKVQTYLDHVGKEWLTENQVSIDSGLKTELTEEFMVGLKNLFKEHYIEVPEDKLDIMEELSLKNKQYEKELNETTLQNINLIKKINEEKRKMIVEEMASGLAVTQADKLRSLSKHLEYTDAATFKGELIAIKETFSSKSPIVSPVTDKTADFENLEEQNKAALDENKKSKTNSDPEMEKYTRTLDKIKIV